MPASCAGLAEVADELERGAVELAATDDLEVADLMAGHGYRMQALVDGRWQPMDAVTDRTRNYLFALG